MNLPVFIDAITGQPFDISQYEIDKYFLLNDEGEEIKNFSTSGINYVYPVESIQTSLENKTFSISDNENVKFTKSSHKLFSISNDDSSIEIISIKKKENEFMKTFLKKCLRMLKRGSDCSKEFDFQCRSLQALVRNVGLYQLENFASFLKDCKKKYETFMGKRRKLHKHSNKIYTDLIVKDLDSSITKKNVKSLFEFVMFNSQEGYEEEDEGDEKKVIQTHHDRVEKFVRSGKQNVVGWGRILQLTSGRIDKIKNNEEYITFVTNQSVKSYERFRSYKDDMSKVIEKLKLLLESHINFVNDLSALHNNGEKSLSFVRVLNEMTRNDFLGKVSEIGDEISEMLFKCVQDKLTMDERLLEFFQDVLIIRRNVNTILRKSSGPFNSLASQVSNVSLRALLFAQNLPEVYEKCIKELLRRTKFMDKLSRIVKDVNGRFIEICDVENNVRQRFVEKSESVLGGQKIPADLVKGIYDFVRIPTVDARAVEANMPDFVSLSDLLTKFEEEPDVVEMNEEVLNDYKMKESVIDPMMSQTIQERKAFKNERNRQRDLQVFLEEVKDKKGKELKKKRKKIDVVKGKVEMEMKEKEKEKAKEYAEKEILLKNEIEELKKQLEREKKAKEFVKKDKEKSLATLKSEIEAQRKLKTSLIKENEDLKAKNEHLNLKMKDGIIKRIETRQPNVNSNSNEISEMKEEIRKAWEEVEKIKKKFEIEKENHKNVKHRNMILDITMKKVEQQMDVMIDNHRLEKSKLGNKIVSVNERMKKLVVERDKMKKDCDFLKEKITKSAGTVQNLKVKVNELNDIVSKFRNEKIKAEEKVKQLTAVSERQGKTIALLSKKVEERETQMGSYSEQVELVFELGLCDDKKYINSLLLKHKGNMNEVVDVLMSESEKRKISEKNRLKNHFALSSFKKYDRVVFQKHDEKKWEIMTHRLSRVKYYLHMDSIEKVKRETTLVEGIIQRIVNVNTRNSDPLGILSKHSSAKSYVLVLIDVEKEY